MHLERQGSRGRRLVLAAVAVVGLVAAACLPPAPAPDPAPATTAPPAPTSPPAPTTTKPPATTTTTTAPSICGVSAAGATAASSDGASTSTSTSGKYVAVVERDGRSKVLTRHVKSQADIEQFRADAEAQGEVTAFEPDGDVHAFTETPTWGWTDSGFSTAWGNPPSLTGSAVRVAELDTGIDQSHPDLAGHFTGGSADIVSAADKSNPPSDTTDPSTSGHGTHVAGIVAANSNSIGVVGGAPNVTLVPVRVLGSSGSGSYSDVAAGLYWAADIAKGNAAVITMSLGGSTSSDAVIQAVADIENPANPNYSHPVITVAAGNASCSTPSFPALLANSTPQMLSVSALCKVGTTSSCPSASPWSGDLPYKLATYSSEAWSGTGTPTGIAAPGTEIVSTVPTGVDATGYKSLSGTSMATPFVAAAAALVRQHCSSDTAAQVVSRLESSADDLGPAGVDTLYGYGRLDAAAAVTGC